MTSEIERAVAAIGPERYYEHATSQGDLRG